MDLEEFRAMMAALMPHLDQPTSPRPGSSAEPSAEPSAELGPEA
jgi:hypothetical protein